MKGILPCPYCGGEVEVVKLVSRKNEPRNIYRIECFACRRLVARGQGFPDESKEGAKLRIKQYKEILESKLAPLSTLRSPGAIGKGKVNPFLGYDDKYEGK